MHEISQKAVFFPTRFPLAKAVVRPTQPAVPSHPQPPCENLASRGGLALASPWGIWHPGISKEASRAARQCRHDETNARRLSLFCQSHVTCIRADIYTQVHTNTPEGRKTQVPCLSPSLAPRRGAHPQTGPTTGRDLFPPTPDPAQQSTLSCQHCSRARIKTSHPVSTRPANNTSRAPSKEASTTRRQGT